MMRKSLSVIAVLGVWAWAWALCMGVAAAEGDGCPANSTHVGDTCVCDDMLQKYNATSNMCVCPRFTHYDVMWGMCMCNDKYDTYDPVTKTCVPLCKPNQVVVIDKMGMKKYCKCKDPSQIVDPVSKKCRCRKFQHYDPKWHMCMCNNREKYYNETLGHCVPLCGPDQHVLVQDMQKICVCDDPTKIVDPATKECVCPPDTHVDVKWSMMNCTCTDHKLVLDLPTHTCVPPCRPDQVRRGRWMHYYCTCRMGCQEDAATNTCVPIHPWNKCT